MIFICTNARFKQGKVSRLQQEIISILQENQPREHFSTVEGEKVVILGLQNNIDTIKNRWNMILQAKQEAISGLSQI